MAAAIDFYVLDALANDIEGFDDLIRLLNSPEVGWRAEDHGAEFVASEVASALARNIRAGWVRALVAASDGAELQELDDFALPAAPFERCYYTLTPRGRSIHRNWQPPTDTI